MLLIFFRGIVTIDVKLRYLDINQCPADFYVANAFKNTAKCDFRSQYVSTHYYCPDFWSSFSLMNIMYAVPC